jgi:N-acetylglutamate synthase-like GNAT family acetyltransferase
MIIRDWNEDDLGAIAQLYYDTVRLVDARDDTAEQLEAWARAVWPDAFWRERFEKCHVFVAEENGEVVGFAEFHNDGHFDCFSVHYRYQRVGVGTRLMRRIEEAASRISLRRLHFEAGITARPFFERRGFKPIGEEVKEYRGEVIRNPPTWASPTTQNSGMISAIFALDRLLCSNRLSKSPENFLLFFIEAGV